MQNYITGQSINTGLQAAVTNPQPGNTSSSPAGDKDRPDGTPVEKPEIDAPEIKKPDVHEMPPDKDDPEIEKTDIDEVPDTDVEELPRPEEEDFKMP